MFPQATILTVGGDRGYPHSLLGCGLFGNFDTKNMSLVY